MANNQKKGKKALWIIIALVLVAAVAAWCVYNAVRSDKGTESVIKFSSVTALLVGIFVITAFGYLLGSVSIKGVSLGTAGVFLVAILFGYLCTLDGLQNIPVLRGLYISGSGALLNEWYDDVISNIGLVLFVGAVGFIAGPNFFKNLKKNAKSFVLLGGIIILAGAACAAAFALIPGIGARFSVGVLSGALTTTPGFSAAKEAAISLNQGTDIITLGHAIAYPFGVIGVVLFVQLIPKIMKADMNKERELLRAGGYTERYVLTKNGFKAVEI